MLTKEEILLEVDRLKAAIAAEAPGSIALPDLTVALVMHYELYVDLILAECGKKKISAA